MQRKLIYVMNHYSKNSVQHFNHIINLLKEIANNGVDIALVVEKCEDYPEIDHIGITVICQKETNSIKRLFELYSILKKLLKIGYKKIFVRISINATIIAIAVAKLYKGKTYYWQSGTTLEVDKERKIISKIIWYIGSYLRFWVVKTLVDNFVTGPESMVEYYIDALNIKPEKMLLLYNDIDTTRFKEKTHQEKMDLRKDLGFQESETIILMVHRLSPVRKTNKYIPEIINDDFFRKKRIRLIIVGDGPERLLLEKNIVEYALEAHISLLGNIPNREIEKFYNIADVFINPSYTEGFPRVLIEAMSCGLPIVATNAGGSQDIFGTFQREYIVDKHDIYGFKKKLIELIEDRDLRQKLGIENLNEVKKYSTEAVSRMYIERIFGDEFTSHKSKSVS